MSVSRNIRFAVAAALISAGWAALLAHTLIVNTVICFCLQWFVLMRRSEFARSVPTRDLWKIVLGLVGLVAVAIVAKLLIPDAPADRLAQERVLRHPAFVIPLWVLTMVGLFWRWRRESSLADAH